MTREQGDGGPPRARRALRVATAAACLAGWVVLVLVAVRAGRAARAGDPTSWWLTGSAVLVAVVLLLGAGRLLVGAVRPPVPPVPPVRRAPRAPGRRVRR